MLAEFRKNSYQFLNDKNLKSELKSMIRKGLRRDNDKFDNGKCRFNQINRIYIMKQAVLRKRNPEFWQV